MLQMDCLIIIWNKSCLCEPRNIIRVTVSNFKHGTWFTCAMQMVMQAQGLLCMHGHLVQSFQYSRELMLSLLHLRLCLHFAMFTSETNADTSASQHKQMELFPYMYIYQIVFA